MKIKICRGFFLQKVLQFICILQRIVKIILHILKWCLDPRADFKLLKFAPAGLIFVLKISSFLFQELWDTEWAEPEGLAAHTSCEYRLCFQHYVYVDLQETELRAGRTLTTTLNKMVRIR